MAGRKPDPPFLVWHTSSGGTPAVGLVHRGVDGHSFPVLTRSYFPPPMSSGSSTVIPMMTPTHMQAQAVYRIPGVQLPRYDLRPSPGQLGYVMGVPTQASSGHIPGKVEDEQKLREKLAKERDFQIQQQRLRDFHASAVGGDQRKTADKLIRDVLGKLDEAQDSKKKQDRPQVVTPRPARFVEQDEPVQRPNVPQHFQKARDWSNLDDLRNVFSSHAIVEDGLPLWCQEGSLVPLLYTQIEEYVTRNGVIDTTLLYPILVSSGLSRETLGHIWSLANRQTPGLLTKSELYAVLALIALAQNACQVTSLSILHSLSHPPVPLLNQVVTQPLLSQGMSLVSGQSVAAHSQPGQQSESSIDNIAVLEDDDDFDEFKSAHGVTIDPSHASATHELETDSFPRHSIGSRLANHHLSQPRIGVGVPKPLLSPFKKEEERENSSEEFSEFQRCTSVPLDSRVTSIPKDPHRDGLNGISTLNIGALDEGVITQQSSPREPVQPPPAGKESLNVSASSGDLLGDSLVEDKYSVLRNLDVVSNIQNQNIRNVPNPASDEDEFGDFLSGVIHSNILPSTECGSSNSVPPDILPYEWTNASPFSPPKLDSEGSQSEFADFQVNGSTTHCVTQNSANESESRPPFLLPSSGNVPWPAMIFESSFGEGKTELPKRPTDSDDEFGDFITTTDFCDLQNTTNRKEGDSISLTSNFFKSKDIISIESQSVSSLDLGIEHSIQSKSSEEAIHDINRHGSVPSLDLKINVEFEDESEVIGMSNLTLTTDHMKPYVTAEPSSVSAKDVTQEVAHHALSDFPSALVDRYSVIRTERLMATDHCYEWQRCLDHCLQVIKDSVKTFNSISSSDVCKELISSEEGENYLKNVIEIYRVACRISLAIKQSNIVDSKLTDTFKNVETEWNNLLPFIIGSPAFPPEDRFDFSHCILDDKDLSNLKLACGVCLLNVKASLPESRMGRQSSEDFKLAYGGRQYHCTCANFWVNFVDSLLPALPFKSRSGS